jgi:hypothetical protein
MKPSPFEILDQAARQMLYVAIGLAILAAGESTVLILLALR